MCEDNSKCIKKSQTCDAHSDCPLNTEEKNCTCQDWGYFECNDGISTSWCIPTLWVCDGYTDCYDDEMNCNQTAADVTFDGSIHCRDDQFLCDGDAMCVPLEWRCDRIEHCPSGGDEANCSAGNL